MSESLSQKITGETVRADFNAIEAVLHYTRAAHFLGLWESERVLIRRHFPDPGVRLLEAGCGAGRVTIGLWHEGYRHVTGFDFAEELVEQARSLATELGLAGVEFLQADATRLDHSSQDSSPSEDPRNLIGSFSSAAPSGPRQTKNLVGSWFDGALFLFNGLMQIPGRENRRAALRGLRTAVRPGGRLIFTSHDRDVDSVERKAWATEAARWAAGSQDPRLREFGDRYFEHEHGRTFMHLPDRPEILADLAATGWRHVEDALRNELAKESRAVRDFSDNCRFWVAEKP